MTKPMTPILNKLKLVDLRTIEKLLLSREKFLQDVIGEPQSTIHTAGELSHTRQLIEKIQIEILKF